MKHIALKAKQNVDNGWKKNISPNNLFGLFITQKKSTIPSLSWSEAVDEALCFGWIDGTRKTIGEFSTMQFFSKRKPKSNWSKINKG